MEGRFIALDVGTRRIGVAASAPGGIMVLPVETVDGRDAGKAARRIMEIIKEYEALGVVVGWPLDMTGREGKAVERVRRFVDVLEAEMKRRKISVPVHRWDERLTTTAADRMLIDADVSRSRRKEAIDQVAACNILQGFIDDWRRRELEK